MKRMEQNHTGKYEIADGYYYVEFPLSPEFYQLSGIDQCGAIRRWLEIFL